jgi:hypothetical protein
MLGFETVKFQTTLLSLSSSLLCEIDNTNGFLTSSSFREVLFQLLIPGLIPRFTAGKANQGFEIVVQLANISNQSPSSHL